MTSGLVPCPTCFGKGKWGKEHASIWTVRNYLFDHVHQDTVCGDCDGSLWSTPDVPPSIEQDVRVAAVALYWQSLIKPEFGD